MSEVASLLDQITQTRQEIISITQKLQEMNTAHNKELNTLFDTQEELNAIYCFRINELNVSDSSKRDVLSASYDIFDQRSGIQRVQQFLSEEFELQTSVQEQTKQEVLARSKLEADFKIEENQQKVRKREILDKIVAKLDAKFKK